MAMNTLNQTTGNVTEDLLQRHGSVVNLFQVFAPTYLIIDRAVTPVWIIIGFIFNPISAKIWLERRMRRNNSSAIYLAALSVCDFVFLVFQIFVELETWGVNTYDKKIWCKVFYLMYYWPQYLSPLLVLGFTVERYIAVCHPFVKERYCTVSRAIKAVLFLTLISLLLAAVQAIVWEYQEVTNKCGYSEALIEFNKGWTFFTESLVFLIVPLAVLVFNVRVLREIKRLARESGSMLPYQQNQSNTAASTITLLCVSFYLILSLLPVTIVFILQHLINHGELNMTDAQVRADPVWTRYFNYMTGRKCIEELCLSHYCCYFFIYIATGAQFRNAFVRLVCRKGVCQSKQQDDVKYKTVHTNGDGATCVTAI